MLKVSGLWGLLGRSLAMHRGQGVAGMRDVSPALPGGSVLPKLYALDDVLCFDTTNDHFW